MGMSSCHLIQFYGSDPRPEAKTFHALHQQQTRELRPGPGISPKAKQFVDDFFEGYPAVNIQKTMEIHPFI